MAPVQVAPVLLLHQNYLVERGVLCHFSLMDSWTDSRGAAVPSYWATGAFLVSVSNEIPRPNCRCELNFKKEKIFHTYLVEERG